MEDLLKAAENDYRAVLSLWDNINEEWGMQAVMFHLQQAIERLLKMLIMISGKEFPHTHDTCELVALYPHRDELPSRLMDLSGVLASWAAESRYSFNLLTNIKTLEECKEIYNDLHDLVLSKMTEERDCSYTLEMFLRDPPTLIAVIEKYQAGYADWFDREFPYGASSAEEVLSKL